VAGAIRSYDLEQERGGLLFIELLLSKGLEITGMTCNIHAVD